MAHALAVLQCPSCGAPLALGRGDEATCSQCGARTQIPAEHRALRDEAGWDAKTRADAEAALHGFDRPPGLFMRAVAAAAGLPFSAVFLVFGAPLLFVDLVLAVQLSRWISGLFGWPDGSIDEMKPVLITAVMGVVLWLMAIVPAFLAAYGGRRVTARSLLVSALAARPPTRPGGPASCRACGAPLEVEADALVARCLYCRAENALQVSPVHLAAARKTTTQLSQTMAEALLRDRAERGRTRSDILRRMRRVSVKTAIGFGLWTVAMWDFGRVQGTDDAPGLGIAACVGLTIFLIYLMASSGGSKDEG